MLETLRKKPKYVHTQIAFVTALMVTGVVFTVWALSLPARLAPADERVAVVSEPQESSFGELMQGMRSLAAVLVGMLHGPGTEGESSIPSDEMSGETAAPPETVPAIEVATSSGDIPVTDLSGMFGTSTTETATETPMVKIPLQQVLIGTSTAGKKEETAE